MASPVLSIARRQLSTSPRHLAELKDAVILSAARTPIGSFRSKLAGVKAVDLGATALKAALSKAKIDPAAVEEVFFGQVVQASVGQNPARQAALGAGLDLNVTATTVNKVCSSGLKSIILAAQQIQVGHQNLTVGGGFESMSNVPFYIARGETPYGGFQAVDGILRDGLTDAYNTKHMGICAEATAKKLNITRKDQDDYALQSYQRSAEAWKNKVFAQEIVPVELKDRKGNTTLFEVDEEFSRVNFDKFRSLRTAFEKDGTITAGNASSLNDAGAAVVLSSVEQAKKLGVTPLAKIVAYGDAATKPADFAEAPALLLPLLLKRAGLKPSDIAQYELNEAFSLVPIGAIRKLDLDPATVNPHGGAVSIGHPIGMSGARLVAHLAYTLKSGQYGLAALCNGGGGACGIIIQKL